MKHRLGVCKEHMPNKDDHMLVVSAGLYLVEVEGHLGEKAMLKHGEELPKPILDVV